MVSHFLSCVDRSRARNGCWPAASIFFGERTNLSRHKLFGELFVRAMLYSMWAPITDTTRYFPPHWLDLKARCLLLSLLRRIFHVSRNTSASTNAITWMYWNWRYPITRGLRVSITILDRV